MIEQNAKIVSTTLGKEDHGIPTFLIMLDYVGGGQGLGQRDLRHGKTFMLIFDILDALELERWEHLVGTYCRVRKAEEWSSPILEIGHIVKDQWIELDKYEGTGEL